MSRFMDVSQVFIYLLIYLLSIKMGDASSKNISEGDGDASPCQDSWDCHKYLFIYLFIYLA